MDLLYGSYEMGTDVIIQPKIESNNSNQRWRYKNGYIASKMTSYVMDIYRFKPDAGTHVIMFRPKGGSLDDNQQWTFQKKDAFCSTPCENSGVCSGPDTCDCSGTEYDGPTCADPFCSM